MTSLLAQYKPYREVEVFKMPLPKVGIIRNDGEYNYFVTLNNASHTFTYTFPGYTFVAGPFKVINDTIYMTPAVVSNNNNSFVAEVLGDTVDYNEINMPRRFIRQGSDTLVELYNNNRITLSLIDDVKQSDYGDSIKGQLIEFYSKMLMNKDDKYYFERVL